MELLIKSEIIAFVFLPFLLGILRRRGSITDKQAALIITTHISLIIGSYYLSLGNPKTLISVPLLDWSVAVTLSLLCWFFGYVTSLWLFRQ